MPNADILALVPIGIKPDVFGWHCCVRVNLEDAFALVGNRDYPPSPTEDASTLFVPVAWPHVQRLVQVEGACGLCAHTGNVT